MIVQQQIRNAAKIETASETEELGDLRFRRLLGDDWARLAPPIRKRFSKRMAAGDTAVYVGEIVETRLTWLGRLFGYAARAIGGPLPLANDTGVAAVVSVTEDLKTGGQIWTRLYCRRTAFPQVIHSAKRFDGPTGLEEYVGCGIGMALDLHAENTALVFRCAHYFFRIGRFRFVLPGWMTPGALSVTHAEEGGGRFSFLLEVHHPRFGPIIRQRALFRETLL